VASWCLREPSAPDPATGETPVLRRWKLPRWARPAGSLLLLGAAFLLFPRGRLTAALGHLDARLIAAALPGYLAIHLAGAWKWHLLAQRARAGLPFLQALECYGAGLFGTLFLPSLAGGDAVTAALAATRAKSAAGVVAAAVLNRALDTLALAVLVSVTVAFVPESLHPEGVRLVHLVWAGGAAAAAGIALAAMAIRPAWRPAALSRLLARHSEALRPVRCPQLAVLPFALSVGIQVAFAALSYAVAHRTGVRIGFGIWLLAWTLAKLVAFLPLTVAGIGARELALAALLGPFGAPAATVVAAGLAWDVVVVAGSLAAGGAWKALGRFHRQRG
jgi:glycosyltransferase 2 family protein